LSRSKKRKRGTEADETVSLVQRNGFETKTCSKVPDPEWGDIYMTLFVAFLVRVSATVFLARAFDAYQA
jgi:hypothetical protein